LTAGRLWWWTLSRRDPRRVRRRRLLRTRSLREQLMMGDLTDFLKGAGQAAPQWDFEEHEEDEPRERPVRPEADPVSVEKADLPTLRELGFGTRVPPVFLKQPNPKAQKEKLEALVEKGPLKGLFT